MRWSRIAATGKDFHTRKRLRACSAAVEPSLTPASCKHSFPSPSRKPPTSLPPPERVCRQRCRRRFIFHSASSVPKMPTWRESVFDDSQVSALSQTLGLASLGEDASTHRRADRSRALAKGDQEE